MILGFSRSCPFYMYLLPHVFRKHPVGDFLSTVYNGPGSIRNDAFQSNRSCTRYENAMARKRDEEVPFASWGIWRNRFLAIFVERLKTKTTLLIIGNFWAHLVGNNKLSANLFNTRWWQLKYFLFSPRTPGEIRSNLTCAYFSNGLKLNHQLDLLKVLFCYFCWAIEDKNNLGPGTR